MVDFGAARKAVNGEQNVTSLVSWGYAPIKQCQGDGLLRQGPWSDIDSLAASASTR